MKNNTKKKGLIILIMIQPLFFYARILNPIFSHINFTTLF
jgi:hypothetical protein